MRLKKKYVVKFYPRQTTKGLRSIQVSPQKSQNAKLIGISFANITDGLRAL